MEIERNLKKKLRKGLALWQHYFPRINITIVHLPSKRQVEYYSKIIVAKDAPVVASDVAGKADYLVTGDKSDFDPLRNEGLPFVIVNPGELLQALYE